MLDYINYNNFMGIAHFIVNLHEDKKWDSNILRKNAILFCHTDHLDILFSNIKLSSNKYILITSGSDWPIDIIRFSKKPPCIKKWYGINASYDHPDLIPIPYGLAPDRGQAKVRDFTWFSNNIEIFNKNEKDKNLLYCNWYNSNSSLYQRSGVLEKLKSAGIQYNWDRNGNIPGSISDDIPFENYCDHASKHKFIVSPPGNGIDCHRTWEALYMGSFPIVIKNRIYNEFNQLPIIQIKDYNELTYDLLYSYLDKDYNYEKLYMEYWKKRINNEFNIL
jgi:hypothetical protein